MVILDCQYTLVHNTYYIYRKKHKSKMVYTTYNIKVQLLQ